MLAGGEIVVLSGGVNQGEESAIFVLIRKGTSASAATLVDAGTVADCGKS